MTHKDRLRFRCVPFKAAVEVYLTLSTVSLSGGGGVLGEEGEKTDIIISPDSLSQSG